MINNQNNRIKLANNYKKAVQKAADHVRHLVKNQNKPYAVAINLAAEEFDVDKGDVSRVLNPPKKAIEWTKPDITEELDEYFNNPPTKKYLSKIGYQFNTSEELKKFLSKGKMKEVLPIKMTSMKNLTDIKSFQKEIEDEEYGPSYKNMREKLQKEIKISLPAPIAFKIENGYYLFSGNRRVNLARVNDLPIKFWIVEIENKLPKQQNLFGSSDEALQYLSNLTGKKIFIAKTLPTKLYHGTGQKDANDIIKNGIDMYKSHKGYFGRGFYLATDKSLAKSNYADFSDDEEGGVVLAFKIDPKARILDLDDPEDWDIYKNSGLENQRHKDDFHTIAVNYGIDGIRDEGSFGGIVVYNPDVLKLEK